MKWIPLLLAALLVFCTNVHAAGSAGERGGAAPSLTAPIVSASAHLSWQDGMAGVQAGLAVEKGWLAAPSKGLETNRVFTASMFLLIIAMTGAVLAWTAGKSRTASDYYAAGGGISGLQNGWAIAGDTLSAATFLGTTGLISLYGLDGFMYAAGPTVCFLTILLIIAEPCRNAGKYTLGDILSLRSTSKVVRGAAAVSAVLISSFYMLVQMVGAGKLMQLLLGIPYPVAVIGVGALIVVYVSLGGMKATTYVQIIKAALLIAATTALAGAVLWRAGMNPMNLLDQVAANSAVQEQVRGLLKHASPEAGRDYGQRFLEMGLFLKDPLDQISLGVAMFLGVAGLPHIMMRFFTVPNAQAARKSVVIAMTLVALFQLMVTFLGLGAAAYVTPQQIMQMDKGGNMAALMLAQLIGGGAGTVGGDLLLAFLCAVAFATIIAVVSGLVLASSAAIAHDLYVNILKDGNANQQTQVRVAKISSAAVGTLAVVLAIACEKQNVVVLASLAFAVAASSNFPVILLSLFWKRMNSAGIVSGLTVGAAVTIGLVLVSPNMTHPKKIAADAQKVVAALEGKQVAGSALSAQEVRALAKAKSEYARNKDGTSLVGLDAPLFPLKNPALVSAPVGFVVTILVALAFRRRDDEMFDELFIRQNTGFGVADPEVH